MLGQRAAFHTDFTFDRSMLQVASYFIGDADPEARNAIAKLNGISVHSYHFAAPGLYDPAALDLIRRQYEAAGWRHLVAAHGKGDPFNAGQTDLWINFAHMDVTGMMVLISAPKDLNLIALNGDISTVDLLHLRGHFGIPRFSGDRFVPARASSRARPPYVAPPACQPCQTRLQSSSRAISRRCRRRHRRTSSGGRSPAPNPARLLTQPERTCCATYCNRDWVPARLPRKETAKSLNYVRSGRYVKIRLGTGF